MEDRPKQVMVSAIIAVYNRKSDVTALYPRAYDIEDYEVDEVIRFQGAPSTREAETFYRRPASG